MDTMTGDGIWERIQYYYLDNQRALQKSNKLPFGVRNYVWESHEMTDTEKVVFTLARVDSYETYEEVIATRDNLKNRERTEIAEKLLGVYPRSANPADGYSQYLVDTTDGMKSLALAIRNSMPAIIADQVVVDTRFTGLLLLYHKRSNSVPSLKIKWNEGAYRIYLKEQSSGCEVRIGAILELADTYALGELYEQMLRLGIEGNARLDLDMNETAVRRVCRSR